MATGLSHSVGGCHASADDELAVHHAEGGPASGGGHGVGYPFLIP